MTHEEHLAQLKKDAELKARGTRAMGFDQDATTHHFRLTRTGGAIEVSAKDSSDETDRSLIRAHLREIAGQFSRGDFEKPLMTHAEVPPGSEVMQRLRAAIAYAYETSPGGGRVRITTASRTRWRPCMISSGIRSGSTRRAIRRADSVRVAYRRDGRIHGVRGRRVILACYNSLIPALVPELPATQKEALAYSVKVPMMYNTVLVRRWTAFQTLARSKSCLSPRDSPRLFYFRPSITKSSQSSRPYP
jgi:hypothetical protein